MILAVTLISLSLFRANPHFFSRPGRLDDPLVPLLVELGELLPHRISFLDQPLVLHLQLRHLFFKVADPVFMQLESQTDRKRRYEQNDQYAKQGFHGDLRFLTFLFSDYLKLGFMGEILLD